MVKKRRTHKEFVEDLYNVNPNIEVIGDFINTQTKIKCKCKIDGYEWESKPTWLLQKRGCPECAKRNLHLKRKRSNEDFVKILKEKNPNIEVLGEYFNARTKIKCCCKLCNHEWMVIPDSLLRGYGCPKCGIKKMKSTQTKTYKDFTSELSHINPNIEILGKYINARTKIQYKCKQCGNIHEATPDNLLKGYGCPVCAFSKGEKRCQAFFEKHNISYISQYEIDELIGLGGNNLRFDFAILNNNELSCLVEYDGIFHYEKQYKRDGHEKIKAHDKIKNEYCIKNNIPLIRIPYWDFDNIEQILTDKLLSKII